MRLQLILKMVDEFGSEILNEPREIITFVGQTLAIGEAEEEAVVVAKPEEKARTGGMGLFDLNIQELEEEKVDVDMEGSDEPIIPGLGADEMIMTALTLLLAVLECKSFHSFDCLQC